MYIKAMGMLVPVVVAGMADVVLFLIVQVMMTVVDTIPKEEIEACRHICEDEVGAVYRVREYIKD